MKRMQITKAEEDKLDYLLVWGNKDKVIDLKKYEHEKCEFIVEVIKTPDEEFSRTTSKYTIKDIFKKGKDNSFVEFSEDERKESDIFSPFCKNGDAVQILSHEKEIISGEKIEIKIEKNSPWREEWIKEKGQEYNDAYLNNDESSNFSFVLDEDKSKLKGDVSSIHFGIPNVKIGNEKEANLFLCLLNARTRNKPSKKLKIQEYVNTEDMDQSGEHTGTELHLKETNSEGYGNVICDNPQKKYYDQIINSSDNVLVQEFKDFCKVGNNAYYVKNLIELRPIIQRINTIKKYINDDSTDKIKILYKENHFSEDEVKFYNNKIKKLIDSTYENLDNKLNFISNFFEKLIEIYYSQKNMKEHYYAKVETFNVGKLKELMEHNQISEFIDFKLGIKNIEQEIFDNVLNDKDYSKLIDINKSYGKDIVNELIKLEIKNQITKTFNPVDLELRKYNPKKQSYYLFTYYSALFGGDDAIYSSLVKAYHEGDKKKNEILKNIEKLGICDLELFPYRSENNPFSAINGKIEDLSSSMYVASLVVDRYKHFVEIDKLDEDKRPIFIFRSFKDWERVITYYLEKYNIKINNKLFKFDFKSDFMNCLKPLSSRNNASITKSNVCDYNDEYIEMRKYFDLPKDERPKVNGKEKTFNCKIENAGMISLRRKIGLKENGDFKPENEEQNKLN